MQHQSGIKLGQPTDDFRKVQDIEIDAQNNNGPKKCHNNKKELRMNMSAWGCCYSTEPAGGGKQCEIGDTAHERESWNGKPDLNSNDVIFTFFMVLNTSVIATWNTMWQDEWQ